MPIVRIPSPGERMERTVNILFNLCTNDHATKADFGKGAALHLQDLEQFQSFPDIADRYPCLKSFAITPIAYMDQLSALTVNAMTKEFADNLHS
ncbi:hypothetical protein ACN4EK_10515 [Pantanalinema rosaneae CENA516]|uniref:hypothetical protein n=1 Tax=Pantanalinema rosaneae TaxID=1620701 RepID=UPI003D6F7750